MVIKIKLKIVILAFLCVAAAAAVALTALSAFSRRQNLFAGGIAATEAELPNVAAPRMVISSDTARLVERFRRPSCAPPLNLEYPFSETETPATKKFHTPEELIKAYYGVLRDASNMLGYTGGCGSIGSGKGPYPVAYELLSEGVRKELPPDSFIDSFEGIGYISLIRLVPIQPPAGAPANAAFYLAEIEVITGKPTSGQGFSPGQNISYFAYFYGVVTAERTTLNGWKITRTAYLPEAFLCAPDHGWVHFSDAVVEIVYKENLGIINKVEKTEEKNGIISIYASGTGGRYRFDFVRLTNGRDVLIGEYLYRDGTWQPVELLSSGWESLKMSWHAVDHRREQPQSQSSGA